MRTPVPKLSKKQFLIAGAVMAVALAAYAVWSVWLWNSYNSAAADRTASAKRVTVRAVVAGETNASANVKGLRAASGELKGIENICEPSWQIAWQTVISSLETTVYACKTKVRAYTQTKAEIDTVVAFLNSEQAVLGVLSPLRNTKKLSDKSWDSTVLAWQTAASDLKQIESSAEYEPVSSMLQTQVNQAVKAWQQLKKADKSENRLEYENAYDSLDQAIAGMSDAANTSDKILQRLLTRLDASVQKL